MIEDSANRSDVAPVELQAYQLPFGNDEETKYPLLSGLSPVTVRLRVAILQVGLAR